MKRILAVMFSLGLISVAGTLSFALPIGSSKAMTASVLPTGGVETWDAVLKDVGTDLEGATSIGWSGVTAGMAGYKVANQYVEINTIVTTTSTWRMLLYTNNTSYTGDTDAGGFGLVNGAGDTGLPLAWCVKDSTTAIETPEFSTERNNGTEGFTDYMWKFLVDKNQTGTNSYDAANDAKYNRVWDSDGFYWNEGIGADMDPNTPGNQPCPAQPSDKKIVLYLGAGFDNSLAEAYSTSSLTLETIMGL